VVGARRHHNRVTVTHEVFLLAVENESGSPFFDAEEPGGIFPYASLRARSFATRIASGCSVVPPAGPRCLPDRVKDRQRTLPRLMRLMTASRMMAPTNDISRAGRLKLFWLIVPIPNRGVRR
jgi:hypothetical protein